MTGGDEAHRLASSALASRLVSFPDGIARHITLSNWHWEALDRLRTTWPDYDLTGMAFERAQKYSKEPHIFEDELRDRIRGMIKAAMPDVMSFGRREVANEPFPSHWARGLLVKAFADAAANPS